MHSSNELQPPAEWHQQSGTNTATPAQRHQHSDTSTAARHQHSDTSTATPAQRHQQSASAYTRLREERQIIQPINTNRKHSTTESGHVVRTEKLSMHALTRCCARKAGARVVAGDTKRGSQMCRVGKMGALARGDIKQRAGCERCLGVKYIGSRELTD